MSLLEGDQQFEQAPPRFVRRLLARNRSLHAARPVAELVAQGPQRLRGAAPDRVVDLARQLERPAERGPADDALLDPVDDVLVAERLALAFDPDLLIRLALDLAHDESPAARGERGARQVVAVPGGPSPL